MLLIAVTGGVDAPIIIQLFIVGVNMQHVELVRQ